jgi:AraC-like DNA-binding protein
MKNDWHYHPDAELLYIKRSTGTWMIGDYVGEFKTGDVILLGPNLPHSLRHEYEYIMEVDNEPGEAIVALFGREMLEESLFALPETRGIKGILSLAERGLLVTGSTRIKVVEIMEKMLDLTPGGKLIRLLYILQLLAESREFEVLASSGFTYESDGIDSARISAIFEYTFNHYKDSITVEEVATLINMGKHSFCRYFKEKTKKTYIEFLIEVRIGIACRLLIEQDMNVAEVCYSSGFNSISHFNHQFRAIKNKSPLDYKRDFT